MKSLLLISSTASLAAALCSHGTTLFPRDSKATLPNFGYDGLTGPLGWYGLNTTTNSACALGRHQSPIDIVPDDYRWESADKLNFTFDDYPDGAEIENLGTTLEVFINGSMTDPQPCRRSETQPTLVTEDECDRHYTLKQFHFHAPGEHHVDGEQYPLEVHFVFQAADGSLSVIGWPAEISYDCTYAGKGRDFISTALEHVDAVAVPGSVGRTGALSFYQSGLGRLMQESRMFRYAFLYGLGGRKADSQTGCQVYRFADYAALHRGRDVERHSDAVAH